MLSRNLRTFNQFGQISGVLGFDGDTHNRGHGKLHDLHVVGFLEGGNGTSLDQELINTDQTANVTARDIFDGLDVTAHHEDGSLDGLFVQVLLLAGHEVGAHDTDLLASGDLAREDTTEGVETALIGGGDHLGDVHHQGAFGVAGLHADGGLIVQRSFVQHFSSKGNKNNNYEKHLANHGLSKSLFWGSE